MAEYAPTIRQRWVARILVDWREAKGLKANAVAQVLGWPQSKISKIETARQAPTTGDILALAAHYRVPEDERDDTVNLNERAGVRGWWASYEDQARPGGLGDRIELESEANLLRTFQNELVPGLLQTQAYTRNLGTLWVPPTTPEGVAKTTEIRMRRQARLTGENPLTVHAVLSMRVLEFDQDDPVVAPIMREQLHKMINQNDGKTVNIQVIPSRVKFHTSMGQPFAVLSFPHRSYTDVAILDSHQGPIYVENPAAVSGYSENFNWLAETVALDWKATSSIMMELADPR
ncbi:helix-turn-helix domain-containing protein [Crossiella sp. CA198]|uniref:helix-turn-helix domain-containing protein n=1 Tax=Crossiella sp. CA198 TaxID=3455607 RepID=UPI003F8D6988